MKPVAPVSGLAFPLAAALASLPLLVESPLWGVFCGAGAAFWAYGAWRHEVDRRPALPELAGEEFAPVDVAIAWRTPTGEFPAARRGWRVVLTPDDLWLAPVRLSNVLGGDRDHVRISRLDVVGCVLASESELRVRFIDEAGRAQEARLSHVPRASELAHALGDSEERKSRIV